MTGQSQSERPAAALTPADLERIEGQADHIAELSCLLEIIAEYPSMPIEAHAAIYAASFMATTINEQLRKIVEPLKN